MCLVNCDRACGLAGLVLAITALACQAQQPTQEAAGRQMHTNSVGMNFRLLPAGEFMMGRSKSVGEINRLTPLYLGVNDWIQNEQPKHRVRMAEPFYLGTTEVTQKQWQAVMGTRPWNDQNGVEEGPDFPATHISWVDAQMFCKQLTEQDGHRYRLPSEAEWEYACRAQTTTIFSFGDDTSKLAEYGWFEDNAYRQQEKYPHQVAQRKPNPWDLFDMHGNVWEWCGDWYGNEYYAQSPVDDPRGPSTGTARVVRGGSWRNSAAHSRSAFRSGFVPIFSSNEIGFRVVLVK